MSDGRNSLIEGAKFSKTFCNYFSFGIDGKIGYGFDMHRTKSRLGNLAMYACMGVIKAATKTKTLDELLETIEIYESSNNRKESTNESKGSMLKQSQDESILTITKKLNSSEISDSTTQKYLAKTLKASKLN